MNSYGLFITSLYIVTSLKQKSQKRYNLCWQYTYEHMVQNIHNNIQKIWKSVNTTELIVKVG